MLHMNVVQATLTKVRCLTADDSFLDRIRTQSKKDTRQMKRDQQDDPPAIRSALLHPYTIQENDEEDDAEDPSGAYDLDALMEQETASKEATARPQPPTVDTEDQSYDLDALMEQQAEATSKKARPQPPPPTTARKNQQHGKHDVVVRACRSNVTKRLTPKLPPKRQEARPAVRARPAVPVQQPMTKETTTLSEDTESSSGLPIRVIHAKATSVTSKITLSQQTISQDIDSIPLSRQSRQSCVIM